MKKEKLEWSFEEREKIVIDLRHLFTQYGLTIDTAKTAGILRHSLMWKVEDFLREFSEEGKQIEVGLQDYELFAEKLGISSETKERIKPFLHSYGLHYNEAMNFFVFKSKADFQNLRLSRKIFESNREFYEKYLSKDDVIQFELKEVFSPREAEEQLLRTLGENFKKIKNVNEINRNLKEFTQKVIEIIQPKKDD